MAPTHCDSCELVVINGVLCHEIGCVHSASRWDPIDQRWVRQRTCDICGYRVDADDLCCDAPSGVDQPQDNDNETGLSDDTKETPHDDQNA